MKTSRSGRLRRASPALVALAAAACAGDPPPGAPSAAPGDAPACVLERRPLATAGGSQIYVEYEDLISVGHDLLLAGSPSYEWRPIAGKPAERLATGAFVGAYIGPPARPVPTPIGGTLASVRVAALDDHRWGAILHEVDPDSLPALEVFRSLWYGEFDGVRWTHLEAVDFAGTRLASRLSSGLVRAGDRLVWLAWETVPPPAGPRRVSVYERIDGVWAHYELPDASRVEQTALAYLEGSGLWMLLSGHDAALPGFQKSLRLYRERSAVPSDPADRWELVSRIAVAEPGEELRFAKLTLHPDGATVSWMAVSAQGSRPMARVGVSADAPGALFALDAVSTFVSPASLPDGRTVWVVDHWDPGARVPELRVLGTAAGQVTRLASIPSPYTAGWTTRATTAHEVFVAGPEVDSDPNGVPVRSLLLRLSTSC